MCRLLQVVLVGMLTISAGALVPAGDLSIVAMILGAIMIVLI